MKNNRLNLTEEQELELMYKYFVHYKKLGDEDKDFYASNGNDIDSRTQMYYFIAGMCGFTDFPQIVNDEKYDDLDDGIELYHGWKNVDHAKNYLMDFDFHLGKGAYGSGMYFTESRENAVFFTQNQKKKTYSRERVMPGKLLSHNGIDSQILYKLCYSMEAGKEITKSRFKDLTQNVIDKCNRLQEFIENIEDPRMRDAFRLVMFGSDDDENSSAFLAYLGIDYIERPRMYDDASHIQLLNRGALLVKQSVYDIFTSDNDRFEEEIDEDEIFGFEK